MNKCYLNIRLATLVLSVGLISCAKDKKTTRDVFQAPPPIIHNKGSQDLRSWDRRSDKSLDLQDSFDVSAGNPARLQVISRCQRGQHSSQESFSFVPRSPIKILQVLPADLLTRDLTERTDCAFELTLYNEIGSKHIYQISSVPLTDLKDHGLILERTGSDEKITKIHARKLEGLRARYRNIGPAAVEIFCHDLTLPALPFEQVVDLIHFDLSKPELRPARPGESLIENPLQNCRMILRQAGRIQQISGLFQLQLPQPPMPAAVAQVLVPSVGERMNFFNGVGMSVAIATITNPDRGGSRILVVPKSGAESTIEIFGPAMDLSHRLNDGKITTNLFTLNWLHALPLETPGIDVQDKGDHWRIHVNAGLSTRLVFRIQPPRPRYCPAAAYRVHTDEMAVAAKLPFAEVSESGEVLNEQVIVLHRVSFPGAQNYERRLVPVTGIPCGW